MDKDAGKLLTVGELARKGGVTVRTLQYYDANGLLVPSDYSEGGRRMYGRRDIVRLHQILFLKSLGFSLAEIRTRVLPTESAADLEQMFKHQKEVLVGRISYIQEAVNLMDQVIDEIKLGGEVGIDRLCVLGIPVSIVKMRESGVLRAYRVHGIPGWAVLFIQSVSAFLHFLVVSMVIFVTAPWFFGASYPQSFPAYFFSLFVLLFASIMLGLLIGVAARSQPIATMLSQAIFLPTIMLGGIMFPASLLPQPLRVLGRLLPATYVMQSFSGFAYGLHTDINATLSLVVTAAIGVDGQRPHIRDFRQELGRSFIVIGRV